MAQLQPQLVFDIFPYLGGRARIWQNLSSKIDQIVIKTTQPHLNISKQQKNYENYELFYIKTRFSRYVEYIFKLKVFSLGYISDWIGLLI